MDYLNILKKRRSIYDLNHTLPIQENELIEYLQQITIESPTAFNMQSSHIYILMDDAHLKLWNIVTETLRKIVPADKFSSTQSKMEMFSKAKGTILFFDDSSIHTQLKENFPTYKDNIDYFASHSMGILQGNIWNALADLNIGASLQHYNPLIDEEVKQTWNIPKHYVLNSEMVFGGINEIPEVKEKIEADKRVHIFKN